MADWRSHIPDPTHTLKQAWRPESAASMLRAGRFTLSLNRPLIMGVVNVTPDSFSDGGQWFEPKRAIEHAEQLIEDGADILDVGGESTRPGAALVSAQEEMERVIPVVEALRGREVPVSVDTSKPAVMTSALCAGAAIINDVFALRQPGAMEVVAKSDAAVCLMHMQGTPQTMQAQPSYDDVVAEVRDFLSERIDAAKAQGVALDRIVVDPGFGFGKNKTHNLALLRGLGEIAQLGVPVLAGLSRKSWLGRITGRPVNERVHASVASAVAAIALGARIVRVHDVAATKDALAVWEAVFNEGFRFYDQ